MKNNNRRISLTIGLGVIVIVYALVSIFYYMISKDQLIYEDSKYSIKSLEQNAITGELVKGSIVEQTFVMNDDAINGMSFLIGTFNRSNVGSIEVSVLEDSSKKLLFQKEFDTSIMKDNAFFKVDIKTPLANIKGKSIRIQIQPKSTVDGNAITLWYNNSKSVDNQQLYVNGQPQKGTLCFTVSEVKRVPFEKKYAAVILSLGLLILSYGSYMIWCQKNGKQTFGLNIISAVIKYRFLLFQLVSRDFKTKYRRSFLGILWSVLNPLLMMIVVSSVFSYVFRFNVDNFPVYLILGQTLFNFLSESTSIAMSSILGSASLIKKVYMPKYIFAVGKVVFSLINFLVSFIAIGIVLLANKVPIHSSIIYLPLIVFYMFIFCLGLGLILSTVSVFFRDTLHLYSVLLTAWSYLTPIFYPVDSLSNEMRTFMNFNPMYYYIDYFRNIILYGKMPTIQDNLICLLISIAFLIIGGLVYKKHQDRFILYI